MDKKQIIIIGLLVVVCILIASIAITLNNQTTPIANNTTKVANNTTEAVVDQVTEESQEQPYSARFENSEYQYNPSTDTYTKDGSGSYIYDYATGEWTSTSSGQWMGSTQIYFDEHIEVSENGDVNMV